MRIYNSLSTFFLLNSDTPHCHSKRLQSKELYLKRKYFWRLKVWEVNSFSAWNAVLEHLIPAPPRTRWIASLRKNPAYGPENLFLKHCYKKVIFDKGVRAKALGGWRNRKICSLNVALTTFWTDVKGKDISQIWDETLVLIKWLNYVRIPLWSFTEEFLINYDLFWIKCLINCDQNICVHLTRLSILWLYFYYPMIVLLNS